MVALSDLFGFLTPKPANKIEQLTAQLAAAVKNRDTIIQNNAEKLAEAEKLVANLTEELKAAQAAATPPSPATTSVAESTLSNQGGGARRRRRTVKRRKTRRTK